MKTIRLSKRLTAISNMVTPGLLVADVGCDHAHLAVYLVQNEIAKKVIATDIHKGPIRRAEETVKELKLQGRIETILCDGLSGLYGKGVECIVLAGMGGPLITEILREGMPLCREVKEFILEPQSDPALLRHFLQDNGFMIISEDMVCEENKFYPVIKCVHGTMNLGREVYFCYGKILIKERNPLLLQYLYTYRRLTEEIFRSLREKEKTESVELRLGQLETELHYMNEAIGLMEEESPAERDRTIG